MSEFGAYFFAITTGCVGGHIWYAGWGMPAEDWLALVCVAVVGYLWPGLELWGTWYSCKQEDADEEKRKARAQGHGQPQGG